MGLKKNVEKAVKRGNVMKYVVHGEVVGGPSLPKQQWRGREKHYCGKQETILTNGELREWTWIFPCFVHVVVSTYSGERFEISVTRRLARTHWALVSARPANATVSFLSARSEMCEYESTGQISYSYNTLRHNCHSRKDG